MKKIVLQMKSCVYKFVKAKGLSAVVAGLVIVLFVLITSETDSLIDVTFFTSILCAIILEGATHFASNIIINQLEDSAKLTTDYEQLIKSYKADWYTYKKVKFPIIFYGWVYKKDIRIADNPEKMYQLPEEIKNNFEEIIAAHDTSTTYNSYMIRVDDWEVKDDVFEMSTSRTTYFNSLGTNRAIDYRWKSGLSIRSLLEYGPYVRELSESQLSNHLGYNGFIESADGYILFIKRSKRVSIGKNTYGTGISASLKTRYALNERKILDADGIKQAFVEEINKEVGLKEKDLCSFSLENGLISVYRDFVEGGKPQFMFYVKAKLDRKDINSIFFGKSGRLLRSDRDQVDIDGNRWVWIKRNDLLNAEVFSSGMRCRGRKYKMMPSASACVAMLVEYLRDEAVN